jgi:CheY-like chemotaxis protein
MMASSPPRKKKILVVDDESSIVTYLTTVLEDAGYEACSAMAPEEAWATAHEERPDVITLDIMMPKRSGFALYQDLKLDPVLCNTPLVFVTAFSRTDDLWTRAR